MPNHYDVDIHCKKCGKYLFSFRDSENDTGKRFCDEHEKKSKKAVISPNILKKKNQVK